MVSSWGHEQARRKWLSPSRNFCTGTVIGSSAANAYYRYCTVETRHTGALYVCPNDLVRVGTAWLQKYQYSPEPAKRDRTHRSARKTSLSALACCINSGHANLYRTYSVVRAGSLARRGITDLPNIQRVALPNFDPPFGHNSASTVLFSLVEIAGVTYVTCLGWSGFLSDTFLTNPERFRPKPSRRHNTLYYQISVQFQYIYNIMKSLIHV